MIPTSPLGSGAKAPTADGSRPNRPTEPAMGLPRWSGALIMRIVLLVFGAAVMLGSLQYTILDDTGRVGAGFVPFVAGSVMTLAGLWDLAKSVLAERRTSSGVAVVGGGEVESASEPTVEEITGLDIDDDLRSELIGEEQKAGWRAVVGVFGVLLGVTLLASWIGLLLALGLMVFALLFFLERRAWWIALVGALLAIAFGYFVFDQLLGVPLPKGALGLI